MQSALNNYIVYCRVERRLSELTWKAYERILRCCLAFLRDEGIAALAEVHTRDLRAFTADQAEHRSAPASQAQTVVAVRCFFSLLRRERLPRPRPRLRAAHPKEARSAARRARSRRAFPAARCAPASRGSGHAFTPARPSPTAYPWRCSPTAACAARTSRR